MIFNGVKKDYLVPLTGRRRSAWAPISRNLITVTGMPGAHLSHTDVQVRVITVPVLVKAENIIDLQKTKEDMAEWLVHDEPKELIFEDEQDRVYYALVDGELDLDEIFSTGQGEITFICPDPFKYGPEKVYQTDQDTFIVENEGTAEAKPIFELEVKEPVTFAMIQNQDGYMMIGQPGDVEQEVVDSRTLVLEERGETLSTWSDTPTQVDSPYSNVDGQMGTDGTGIVPLDYGTGTRWHGPALIKEIPTIQDFEVEMRCRVELTNPNQTFRIEFYLFDEYFNVLGKMAVMDATVRYNDIVAEGRYGEYRGDHSNYLIYSQNYSRKINHFHGLLRMRRIGQRFEFYVARLTDGETTPTHFDQLEKVWNDVSNHYQGKLRYVQIHFGKYADSSSAVVPRINSIKVYELKNVTQDQTPYIAYPGDIITFDHVNKDILINGESRKDLKAFGGSFFTLKKGVNTLTITPENVFDTKITYRERYK